ncbi:PD-(D/E)XK nuclease-like domain-containing protein [Yersinia kristensenii]|uniref:Exodeoxyribonuclease 8 n=1 Tax=Yersinia kristensenii TaxID=28152 RepID=A0A0T9L9Z5_YERKR|nr:Exodeoxyribonuclease 8 [Yersinia kristensenii]
MSEINKITALGMLVSRESDITDQVKNQAALILAAVAMPTLEKDSDMVDTVADYNKIFLAVIGVAKADTLPVDHVLGAINSLYGMLDDTTGNVDRRKFLRDYLANLSGDTGAAVETVTASPVPELAAEQTPTSPTEEKQLMPVEELEEVPAPAPNVPAYFEPGRYEGISNDVYHASNGISSSQIKDARVSLMYFHGRHITGAIKRESTEALTFGSLCHTMVLEPEKLDEEFSIEPVTPAGAFTSGDSMTKWLKEYNAALPALLSSDEIKVLLEAHNATLPAPYSLGGSVDDVGNVYTRLPAEFQTIPDGQKFTATLMKACIKEYNATLPVQLKTSGSRDTLLEQLAIISPEVVEAEAAKPAPLNTSGKKEDLAAAIKTVKPDALFADEITAAWLNADTNKSPITLKQYELAKAIQQAVFDHPAAGGLVNNPNRAVEVSYYGMDEDTGIDIRVRPDQEIDFNGIRVCFDLKTIQYGRIKQEALRSKLHRTIIDFDYHVSAAMYCDVGDFDQFFWIFVNKDEGYHWIAIVEASPDELELGRLEYKKALRDIQQAQETDHWPSPITSELVDELNDFDLRRLEALRLA